MTEFAHSKQVTTAQLALAWLLNKDQHLIPIPGTKKAKYLIQNARAVYLILTSDEMKIIETIIARFPDTGERYTAEALKLVNH